MFMSPACKRDWRLLQSAVYSREYGTGKYDSVAVHNYRQGQGGLNRVLTEVISEIWGLKSPAPCMTIQVVF